MAFWYIAVWKITKSGKQWLQMDLNDQAQCDHFVRRCSIDGADGPPGSPAVEQMVKLFLEMTQKQQTFVSGMTPKLWLEFLRNNQTLSVAAESFIQQLSKADQDEIDRQVDTLPTHCAHVHHAITMDAMNRSVLDKVVKAISDAPTDDEVETFMCDKLRVHKNARGKNKSLGGSQVLLRQIILRIIAFHRECAKDSTLVAAEVQVEPPVMLPVTLATEVELAVTDRGDNEVVLATLRTEDHADGDVDHHGTLVVNDTLPVVEDDAVVGEKRQREE